MKQLKTKLITEQLLRICFSLLQDKNKIVKTKHKTIPRKKQLVRYYLNKRHTIYLSQREAECVVLFLEDYDDAKTAKVLGISERTVEYYVQKIKEKLGCHHKRQITPIIKASAFMEHVAVIKSTLAL